MNTQIQTQSVTQSWDLFRLSKSKQIVDLVPNTIRAYHAQGLALYRKGKVVFVSKSELEAFIKGKAVAVQQKNKLAEWRNAK